MAYNRKAYNRSAYNALAGVITLISFSYAGTSTQPSIAVGQTSFPTFTQNGSLGTNVAVLQTDFIFSGYSGTSSQGVSCIGISFPSWLYAGTSTQPSFGIVRSANPPEHLLTLAIGVNPTITVDVYNPVLAEVMAGQTLTLDLAMAPSITTDLASSIISLDLRQFDVLIARIIE